MYTNIFKNIVRYFKFIIKKIVIKNAEKILIHAPARILIQEIIYYSNIFSLLILYTFIMFLYLKL